MNNEVARSATDVENLAEMMWPPNRFIDDKTYDVFRSKFISAFQAAVREVVKGLNTCPPGFCPHVAIGRSEEAFPRKRQMSPQEIKECEERSRGKETDRMTESEA